MFGLPQGGDSPLSQAIAAVFWVLIAAIFIRALLSWFSIDPRNPLIEALNAVTEPILEPIRRFMPNLGLDLSPLIAIIVLEVVANIVVSRLG
ncbi:MAG: YggT family protein [Dehalococcoidia bacterium]|nr:YggT family protein [Dehalococcoidia bacterium]